MKSLSNEFSSLGYFTGSIPAECVKDCARAGNVTNDVAYWREKLNFTEVVEKHRILVEDYLREYGAWDDISDATDETLADRVLWLACCEIRENGEWIGLVH